MTSDESRGKREELNSGYGAAAWPGGNALLSQWVIVLGGQPHLRGETLRQLIAFDASQPDRICQPSRGGRPRHPVVLPNAIFHRLKDSREETLKQFLQNDAP